MKTRAKWNLITRPLGITLLGVMMPLLFLTGCQQPSTLGGNNGILIEAPPETNPSPNTTVPPPNIERGNQPSNDTKGLVLASEILKESKNPFFNKLPKIEPVLPEEEVSSGEGPGEGKSDEPPPFDPLKEATVNGIIYHPNKPMALLTFADGGGEGGGGTGKIVRKGDIIPINNTEVKVLNISRNAVEMVELTKPQNRKTLMIPDIIGYSKGKSEGSEKSTPSPDETSIINLPPFTPGFGEEPATGTGTGTPSKKGTSKGGSGESSPTLPADLVNRIKEQLGSLQGP